MILYRPVGLEELRLIYRADMRSFPARLPEQPFFYPVISEQYAIEIARDWNAQRDSRAGFVTRFAVDDDYVDRFERRAAGGREREELWVPAAELATFNAHLRGAIQVVAAFFGEGSQGYVPSSGALRGKNATEQFLSLMASVGDSGFYVASELDNEAVFLNFFFWQAHDFTPVRISAAYRDRLLEDLKRVWVAGQHASVPLGIVRDAGL